MQISIEQLKFLIIITIIRNKINFRLKIILNFNTLRKVSFHSLKHRGLL